MKRSTLRAALAAAFLAIFAAPDALAALDTTALTTDQSINKPAGWWIYNNATPTQVSSYLSATGGRLTEISVDSIVSGVPRFTVRIAPNSGAYAVGGWWWYYGLTFSQIGTQLTANSARLIDMEPYDSGGGVIKYAVVMVSNTGSAARAWSYMSGVSSAQIANQLSSSGHRLVDLDTYSSGGIKRYSMIAVANTGGDAEAWEWWLNQTTAGIGSHVNSFGGRVIKLDRQADGTYNFIQVKNAGTESTAWWHQYGFSSGTAIINYANQLAARPVSVTSYMTTSGRRYDAAFIDNANAGTRRMRGVFAPNFLDAYGNPTKGIFEAYLKRVDVSSPVINLNGSRRAEVASSLKSLHLLTAMRRVQNGSDTLDSSFLYYDYISGTNDQRKNACPDPSRETPANSRTNYNFETGLDEMMRISDNRTTRGTVLRYGGFAPFNTMAATAGLTNTVLRHNIGCAYWNLSTQKYDTSLRNDTTAADLAHIYEGVWNATLLNNSHWARAEFLESANPSTGSSGLQTIINAEATKLGKSSTIATQFGSLIQRWGKGGSYGTCLPDANGACGQKVIIRSGTGLIRLPIKVSGVVQYRTYSYGRLVSDIKVPCWENFDTTTVECPSDTTYTNAFNNASVELFRDEIRLALMTW